METKNKIEYIVQDVREPIGDGHKYIIHCCNDLRLMGSGVARALFEKWGMVRKHYMEWNYPDPLTLGEIQVVPVADGIDVINMVAQHGITIDLNGVPPIRYDAMRSCLEEVADLAKSDDNASSDASVHVPYLCGCDLAGGDWNIVESLLKECLVDKGIRVVAYDIFNRRTLK